MSERHGFFLANSCVLAFLLEPSRLTSEPLPFAAAFFIDAFKYIGLVKLYRQRELTVRSSRRLAVVVSARV